jgi:hypothetical protein
MLLDNGTFAPHKMGLKTPNPNPFGFNWHYKGAPVKNQSV